MKLKRFLFEVVFDNSYFERDNYGRKVFRYRQEKKFFPIRAKNSRNARRIADRLQEDFRGLLVETRLYAEL